jgi:hypothetical protein
VVAAGRAATTHRGGLEAALIERGDNVDELANLGRVGRGALGKVVDMLDFSRVRLQQFYPVGGLNPNASDVRVSKGTESTLRFLSTSVAGALLHQNANDCDALVWQSD